MHPDAPFTALFTSVPAGALPKAVEVVWRRRAALQIRDLFEWEPAPLAEALDLSEDELGLLLSLRAGLPRARVLVERLAAEGITLVTVAERTYPAALREALGDEAPRALWLAGSRDPLLRGPVTIVGERDAPESAVNQAQELARITAREGRSVLTGVATAIERAVLQAVLAEPGGTAVGVSHYGINRTLPNLRPWRQAIREGRLLLLSHTHPEASWEPGLEDTGYAVLAGLAERMILVRGGRPGGADRCARLSLALARPVFISAGGDDESTATLRAAGARLLSDPLGAGFLADVPVRKAVIAAEPEISPDAANEEPAPDNSLEDVVLRYLTGKRRPIGKGALLRALAVEEATLDRALISLIARGAVAQRLHRTGFAYIATGEADAGSGAFQLSIFGTDERVGSTGR
jgi:predicted Rossmann fold nucleotide-binding protein DprA/Smf involved in DNA uptake